MISPRHVALAGLSAVLCGALASAVGGRASPQSQPGSPVQGVDVPTKEPEGHGWQREFVVDQGGGVLYPEDFPEDWSLVLRLFDDPGCLLELETEDGSELGPVEASFMFEGWILVDADNAAQADRIVLRGECCLNGCDLVVLPRDHAPDRVRVDGYDIPTLTLSPKRTTWVQVLTADGRPVPGAEYWHDGSGWAHRSEATTNAEGWIEVQLQAHGVSSLVFGVDCALAVDLEVPSSTVSPVEVRFPADETFVGIGARDDGLGMEVSCVNPDLSSLQAGTGVHDVRAYGIPVGPLEVFAAEPLANAMAWYPQAFTYSVGD